MSLQSTDPIADLLTRIRNAALVGKTEVRVPTSKLKNGKPRGTLVITINNNGENAAFTELARVSKPGRRVYVSSADIPKVKQGRGIVLVSTSKGVMTGAEAVKNKLGGEVLLKVY